MKKGIFEPGLKRDSTVLIPIIKQYLAAHKRLVVPQLGAFIVKEPERSIVFSELLKRDDGVLRGFCATAERGIWRPPARSTASFSRCVTPWERGQEYPLEGLGVMKPGPNGTIAFVYAPAPAAPLSGGERPVRPPQLEPGKLAEAVRTAFAEPHVSPSAKMNPDPSVRGLRYGKPHKNTDACRYVDRVPRRRGADWFIWIAIIAAVIAAGAIAFGYWRDAKERQAEAEYIEAPAAGGVSQPEQNE